MSEIREIRQPSMGELSGALRAAQIARRFCARRSRVTGTHIGCEQGSAAPARSCSTARRRVLPDVAVQARGCGMLTVEGLARVRSAPAAQAFHEHHALQCGYLHARDADRRAGISRDQPRPDRGRDLRRHFLGAVPLHRLCEHRQGGRCRGGVMRGTRQPNAFQMTDRELPYVGRSLLRREDRRLLTGRGQFIADLELPRCCMRPSSAARWLTRASARSICRAPPRPPG